MIVPQTAVSKPFLWKRWRCDQQHCLSRTVHVLKRQRVANIISYLQLPSGSQSAQKKQRASWNICKEPKKPELFSGCLWSLYSCKMPASKATNTTKYCNLPDPNTVTLHSTPNLSGSKNGRSRMSRITLRWPNLPWVQHQTKGRQHFLFLHK